MRRSDTNLVCSRAVQRREGAGEGLYISRGRESWCLQRPPPICALIESPTHPALDQNPMDASPTPTPNPNLILGNAPPHTLAPQGGGRMGSVGGPPCPMPVPRHLREGAAWALWEAHPVPCPSPATSG